MTLPQRHGGGYFEQPQATAAAENGLAPAAYINVRSRRIFLNDSLLNCITWAVGQSRYLYRLLDELAVELRATIICLIAFLFSTQSKRNVNVVLGVVCFTE